jgi:pectin methylesterase-like acyl-CoA thioesterase
MYNMNIKNDTGQSAQAVALSTGGNYQSFYASYLLGWQDTTYVHTKTQFLDAVTLKEPWILFTELRQMHGLYVIILPEIVRQVHNIS